MALEELRVNSTEQLDADSRAIIKLCHEIEACIQNLEEQEGRLEGWVSERKEDYMNMLKTMCSKLRKMLEIALSYGEVGAQQAAIFEGTEEAISALADKISDDIMG